MMAAASRRTGAAGELEVVELLRANGWPRAMLALLQLREPA